MQWNAVCAVVVLAVAVCPSMPSALGQSAEDETVRAASAVLNETMATPLNRIPQTMLANAHGVAIIPNVLKGGFIVGARHGRGLLFVREADGWHPPVFITLTGGNIGWQVGVQSSDIVLVFKTVQSVQGILNGKLTIGADAAAAAGPVGRQGAVATDGNLQAEIYSYSRSRGLFAGVSIDGSVLRVDSLSTGSYYRSPAPGQPVIVPPAALQLTQLVSAYAGANVQGGAVNNTPALAQQFGATEADVVSNQLVQIAPRLSQILDDQWKAYLAIPPAVFLSNAHPDTQELKSTIERFDAVASNPQYQQLASRPEFQSVHSLLKHYQQALQPNSAFLQLPPPPTGTTPTGTTPSAASPQLVLPK